jgi:hypothetical protein
MKSAFIVLFLSALSIGCVSCADYPQNEPSQTDSDIHLSGPGSYGGEESPTNNNTPTPPPTNTAAQ